MEREQTIKICTTEQLEPYKEVLGLVYGKSVRASGPAKDALAVVKDFFGGRFKGYEEELEKGIAEATKNLIENASKLSAKAVIGTRIEIMPFGQGEKKGGFFVILVYGTAVR